MAAEEWPTSAAATEAVQAAARKAFEDTTEAKRAVFPPGVVFPEWDDLDAVQRNEIASQVLPIVWAALAALPDPRHSAWEEGLASADYDFESASVYATVENPYPSGL